MTIYSLIAGKGFPEDTKSKKNCRDRAGELLLMIAQLLSNIITWLQM